MERPCKGPRSVWSLIVALAVAFVAAAIVFPAEVQLSAKVAPVSAIRYGDRVYRGQLRVAVPLRPGAPGSGELVGELELSVLSNVDWVLYVSLVEGTGDASLTGSEVTIVLDREEIAIGTRPTPIISGSNGVFPLRLHLRAASSPEARGSIRGEVVLLLTLATQVRP